MHTLTVSSSPADTGRQVWRVRCDVCGLTSPWSLLLSDACAVVWFAPAHDAPLPAAA